MLKFLGMVLMALFGFGYGKVWWPLAAANSVPDPQYVGAIVLAILGSMGLSGVRWIPSVVYGLCMFAGFGIAAVL